jgi:hypothetical protein
MTKRVRADRLATRLERLEQRRLLAGDFQLVIDPVQVPEAPNPYGLAAYDDTLWASAYGSFGATNQPGYLTWDADGAVTVHQGSTYAELGLETIANVAARGEAGSATMTLANPADAANITPGMRVSGGVQTTANGAVGNAVGNDAIVLAVDGVTGEITLNAKNLSDLRGPTQIRQNFTATGAANELFFTLTNPADAANVTVGMQVSGGAVNPQNQPIDAFNSTAVVTAVNATTGVINVSQPLLLNLSGIPGSPLDPAPLASGTAGSSFITLQSAADAGRIEPGMLVGGGIRNGNNEVVPAFEVGTTVLNVAGTTVNVQPANAVLADLGSYNITPPSSFGPVLFQPATPGTVTFSGFGPGPVTFQESLPSQQLTAGQPLCLSLPVNASLGSLESVRVIFTVGGPGWLAVDSTGGVAAPTASGDQYYRELMFDFVEFTLNVNAQGAADTFFLNTSEVDQFGFPIQIEVNPQLPNTPRTVGVIPPRAEVFDRYADFINQRVSNAAVRDFYLGLATVQQTADGGDLRIMSPKDRAELAAAPNEPAPLPEAMNRYFDGQISQFFDTYETSNLTMLNVPGLANTGKGSGGGLTNLHDLVGNVTTVNATGSDNQTHSYRVLQLTDITPGDSVVGNGWTYTVFEPFFSTNGYPGKPPAPIFLTNPTETPTAMVFAGDGVFADNLLQPVPSFATTNKAAWQTLLGAIENQIVSALNRGIVLNDYADWTYSSQYYTVPTQVTVNPGDTLTQAGSVFSIVPGMAVTGPGIPTTEVVTVTGVSPAGGGANATYTLSANTTVNVATPDQAVTFSYQQVANPFYGGSAATLANNPERVWNYYAQFLHQDTISRHGLAYALSYDDQGQFSSVLANGPTPPPAAATVTIGAAAVRPAVDLNGDGIQDVVWHNETGGTYVGWVYDASGSVSDTRVLIGGDWELAAVGYFNEDNVTDFVWRYTGSGEYEGHNVLWNMNADGTIASNVGFGGSADVAVETSGDYNGDGITDLVWKMPTSDHLVWIMTAGGGVAATTAFATDAGTWRLAPTGADYDANGDGKTDLIWHRGLTDAALHVVYLMDGANPPSQAALPPGPDGTLIVATGDYNGDRIGDLIWAAVGSSTVEQQLMGYGSGPVVESQNTVVGEAGTEVEDSAAFWGRNLVWRSLASGLDSVWTMSGSEPLAKKTYGGSLEWRLIRRPGAG